MSFFRRNRLSFLLVLGTLLLTGCLNRQTPVEKIYEVLEKVVESEQAFEEQQDPLVKLEKNEKRLYDKIISLGMKEHKKIIEISDEALENVKARKDHMDKEEKSIKDSQKEFEKVSELIDEIEDAKVKKKADNLNSIMLERYRVHDDLYQNYQAGLELDQGLYKLFKKKDVSIEELEAQILKINEAYKKVLNDNKRFNEETEKYNKAKLDFYKEAGLEIESQE